MKTLRLAHGTLVLTLFLTGAARAAEVEVVDRPGAASASRLYPGNREPLTPSPFVKLPIGSITPAGWLRHMLELERDGMVGHLAEISPWLDFAQSSWSDPQGRGKFGWEEMPYWLKGYGDLGYVLGDEAIIAQAKRWIEAALASQRDDGWFGPRELLTALDGQPDLWPHMVMLNVLQSYYEYSGDPRVIEVMTRYMQWQNQLPASAFGAGYWPRIRAGDNIESACWLYNRTGHPWLLDLARKIHQGMARWDTDVINWHNVNLAQGFRAGTVAWMVTHDPNHLASAERNYTKLMGLYGQFPGGGFVGDENCRPGFVDPRGGIETCGIVEFMHSFQMLMRITGEPRWIDRCEEIAFNSFPASMTPDQKGLHYITSANQVQLDRHNKAPGIQNGGTMFSYSPFECYRCCQHNVSHGWPYYAEELWLATPDNGLCASLYAACDVTARVGTGTEVRITATTDYPFDETVTFRVTLPQATAFPLYLRVPSWCEDATVSINGQPAAAQGTPGALLRIARSWNDGDTVTLTLPMEIVVRTWHENQDAVSVDRGPLSYSLAIAERWETYGDRQPQWPEWEVFADSDWNYGLVLDADAPARSLEFTRQPGPVPPQPFTPESSPVRITARARKIPNWQMDRLSLVDKLQPSPVRTEEAEETVTLIPMGAARLRISTFPTVTTGPGGHVWTAPPEPRVSQYRPSASHCFGSDTVDALDDGLEPVSSNDGTIPRMTWWPHQGTQEWVQYEFAAPKKVSGVAVYWFDDRPGGGCAVPHAWRVLYRAGDQWQAVPNPRTEPVRADAFNRMEFDEVETTALRLEVDLQPGLSGGILEWKLGE